MTSLTNSFAATQNTETSLEKLRAASFFYGRAKVMAGFQFCLSVPGALAVSIMIAVLPSARVWGVLYSIAVSLSDVLLFDRLQARLRMLGAKAQEEFDAGLFRIPWRTLQVGARLTPEETIPAIKKYRGGDAHLHDWYAPVVGELSFPLDALLCQRINVWWDAEVRRKLGRAILGILTIVASAIIVVGIAIGQPTDRWVLSILSPLLPVVIWCVRESRRQFDAATRLDAIKSAVCAAWSRTISDPNEELRSAAAVSDLQAAIFDGRSRNPLVFDWIHRRFRPEGQETMNEMAVRLVNEAKEKE